MSGKPRGGQDTPRNARPNDKAENGKGRAFGDKPARPPRDRSEHAPADGARSERAYSERPNSERTYSDRSGASRTARPRLEDDTRAASAPRRKTRADAVRADRAAFAGDRPAFSAAPGTQRSRPPRRPGTGKGPTPTTNPHPARAGGSGGKEPQRIAKLLARAGIASRRDIERMIADGRIALDGVVLDTPATLLDTLRGVTVDGNPVGVTQPTQMFLFNKPSGFLTTARDPRGRPTIYDRLPRDLPRVMPIGRLDMSTEGLLLLTTDGEFKRRMELPASGVERTYRARAYGAVSQAQLEELIHGIEIEGVRYGRIDANLERRTGSNQWIEMTLTEGKNREVRRVLEHLGLEVNRLIRTRYGPFELGDLAVGGLYEVPAQQLGQFIKSLK